jgi:hypothetical protein
MSMKQRQWVGVGVVALWGLGCSGQAIEMQHAAGGQAGAKASGGASGAAHESVNAAGSSPSLGGAANESDGDVAGQPPMGPAGAPSVAEREPSHPGDPCQDSCSSGYDCFQPVNFTTGVCVPLCDAQEQTEWGKPCSNPLTGSQGTCRPVLKHVAQGALSGVGVCTAACDPIAQDCPPHFACDVTEDEAGAAPNRIFQCLPLVESPPRQQGDACTGFPLGECGPGLSCVPGASAPETWTCEKLCDVNAAAACELTTQTCQTPDYFPPGTTIGVCLESQ